ncbi:MAG: tRNA preQ1(34) S-adenosylmethionine ribosyltransferase-isomerase QueA [Acidobacteriota bacterium]
MKVSDFEFGLPPELIAQYPPAARGDARLLVLDRATGGMAHALVADLPRFLAPGDVLVLNNTRVFPARLIGTREPGGGTVECLLTARVDDERWEALVHPGQRLHPGRRMRFARGGHLLHGEILEERFHGRRLVRLWADEPRSPMDIIEAIGHIPLPPYIKRPDLELDRDRYQTVFARETGSVAAPTAGLHMTGDLLERLAGAGVERVEITLHVGYGTFKPVRVAVVEDHVVDPEHYAIAPEAATRINAALDEGRRLVVVGTTTTRALEHAVRRGAGRVEAGIGQADLFIFPGYRFGVVGALLTNFHLPASSLLMLVSAFGGRDRVLEAYREAIRRRYRFYSYGDAMLLL